MKNLGGKYGQTSHNEYFCAAKDYIAGTNKAKKMKMPTARVELASFSCLLPTRRLRRRQRLSPKRPWVERERATVAPNRRMLLLNSQRHVGIIKLVFPREHTTQAQVDKKTATPHPLFLPTCYKHLSRFWSSDLNITKENCPLPESNRRLSHLCSALACTARGREWPGVVHARQSIKLRVCYRCTKRAKVIIGKRGLCESINMKYAMTSYCGWVE